MKRWVADDRKGKGRNFGSWLKKVIKQHLHCTRAFYLTMAGNIFNAQEFFEDINGRKSSSTSNFQLYKIFFAKFLCQFGL